MAYVCVKIRFKDFCFSTLVFCLLFFPALIFAGSYPEAGCPENITLAGAMDDFIKGFRKGFKSVAPPTLTSLSPNQVEEATCFTLQLKGDGFDNECRVMIQVQDPNSDQLIWKEFLPQFVDVQTLELNFDKGFSADPNQRRIYVKNRKEKKSQELLLTIRKPSANIQSASDSSTGIERAPVESVSNSMVIDSIDPQSIQKATPFTLNVSGRGFRSDCKVYVEINKNADQKDAEPEYDFVPLDPVFISESKLQLIFKPGFNANPSKRRIYVEDSAGNRSNEVTLDIYQ